MDTTKPEPVEETKLESTETVKLSAAQKKKLKAKLKKEAEKVAAEQRKLGVEEVQPEEQNDVAEETPESTDN